MPRLQSYKEKGLREGGKDLCTGGPGERVAIYHTIPLYRRATS